MTRRTNSQRKNRPQRGRRNLFSRQLVFLGAILVVALIVAVVWFFNAREQVAAEIGVSDAYREVGRGAFLLDVREPQEWDAFHIPGATLIPLGELQARIGEVPRDREVIVVCRSGNRSRSGRDILLDAGFTQVTSLTGGVTAWSDAGYPIEGTRP